MILEELFSFETIWVRKQYSWVTFFRCRCWRSFWRHGWAFRVGTIVIFSWPAFWFYSKIIHRSNNELITLKLAVFITWVIFTRNLFLYDNWWLLKWKPEEFSFLYPRQIWKIFQSTSTIYFQCALDYKAFIWSWV